MTDRNSCPACGGSLPPGALEGACPRCLLAAGLGPGAADEADDEAADEARARPVGDTEDAADAAAAEAPTAAAPRRERRDPPSIAEIAPHFPLLTIEALIGAGGMGIVYRARQTALDRTVALKVLWPELAADRTFAERFTREARAMARLDHPHIVRVFEYGESGGLWYLVMEFIDGKNLRELMDAGGIRPEEALAIVPQICDGLQYAHDQGVVHRDIKPANVLVDRAGRVRIADFGLAKLVAGGDDLELTRAGQVMGTPHYMAPEQYRSPDHVDHRADIYSLGVVFYEMLTGDVPVGRFEAPSERVKIDVRLDRVVLRSLEREPERRYQRAADVGSAVTSISSGPAPAPAPTPSEAAALASAAAVGPVAPVAAAPPPAPPTRPRLSKLAVAALLLVGVQIAFALGALAAPSAIVPSLAAAALAVLLGFVACVRILVSANALRGVPYALGAMVVPWAVGCGGLLALGFAAAGRGVESMDPVRIDENGITFGDVRIDEQGVRVGDWIQITDDGVRVTGPIEIDDRGVRRAPGGAPLPLPEPAPEPDPPTLPVEPPAEPPVEPPAETPAESR